MAEPALMKKARTCITPSMLVVLQSAFDLHGGHPSAPVRQSLAMQLGMTPKSVQVWFQNRRQKLRAMHPHPASSRPGPGALLGSSRMHFNSLLGSAALDGMSASSPAADAEDPSPVLRSTRLLPSDLLRSPPGGGVATTLSPALSPALLSALTSLVGRGGASSADALLNRAMLSSLPRHLVTELANLTSAEHELMLLASHLSKRKAQLVANIARHEATGVFKLNGTTDASNLASAPPTDSTLIDQDGQLSPAATTDRPWKPDVSSSSSPALEQETSNTSVPKGESASDAPRTPGRQHLDGQANPPSKATPEDGDSAPAAALSGLHLLSSMATNITSAPAMAISAA
mmetsp:Transcript_27657/g.84305  ORF Transcript_27657/g.84305 Transcript_27657/m.84305 type:complete len:345 (+) Transcript_27657:36-1070(+)